MRFALTFGLLLGVAAGARAESAAAGSCSCAAPADHAVKELSRHQSAFAGKVTEVTGEAPARRVTFDVARVWKGPRGRTITLTSTGTAGCTASFEVGREYLVYADGAKDALTTDQCRPNRELASAATAVRQLDLNGGYGSDPLRAGAH